MNNVIILNEFEYGTVGIKKEVLESYVKRIIERYENIVMIPKKRRHEQYLIVTSQEVHNNIDFTIQLVLFNIADFDETIAMLQSEVKKELIQFLGVPVGMVNIVIADVHVN